VTVTTRSVEESTLEESLEPVHQALTADGETQAREIVSEATRAADDLVAQAERHAEIEVDNARRRNERSATASVDQTLARARADAHRVVLQTQARHHQHLIDEVRDAAMAMRRDPRYPALLDHLETLAKTQLGSTAAIERDPDLGGGVRAVAGNRQVDYTLEALADRALDTLADEVTQLWT
jgi:vacuolar-type H+-ATPase subunit E/Vma4